MSYFTQDMRDIFTNIWFLIATGVLVVVFVLLQIMFLIGMRNLKRFGVDCCFLLQRYFRYRVLNILIMAVYFVGALVFLMTASVGAALMWSQLVAVLAVLIILYAIQAIIWFFTRCKNVCADCVVTEPKETLVVRKVTAPKPQQKPVAVAEKPKPEPKKEVEEKEEKIIVPKVKTPYADKMPKSQPKSVATKKVYTEGVAEEGAVSLTKLYQDAKAITPAKAPAKGKKGVAPVKYEKVERINAFGENNPYEIGKHTIETVDVQTTVEQDTFHAKSLEVKYKETNRKY